MLHYKQKNDLSRANQIKDEDTKQVKADVVNALTELQNTIKQSLTNTQTYALGDCLNRCKTSAKAMLLAHDSNKQVGSSGPSNKKRSNKKRSNKKRSNKNRSNKKYY